jgi:hypothetical protein
MNADAILSALFAIRCGLKNLHVDFIAIAVAAPGVDDCSNP